MRKAHKALALMSGGLDSVLAAKIIMEQGIYVEAINFVIGFGGKVNPALYAANQLGVKLHVADVVEEFKGVLLNPKHGYGANLNPCLDCKIFMVHKAWQWMRENDFDCIITGEVIGQRPMSQRKDTLPLVARLSKAEDLILRPLSAKNLAMTLPEREGWVQRELLYAITGRSRREQIALAKKFAIDNYQQPAGGCLLTEPGFCRRLKDLWQARNQKDYDHIDLDLLQIGRHLRLRSGLKLIIGRNEQENDLLKKHQAHFVSIYPINYKGAIAIIDGSIVKEDLNFIAQIVAFFSKGKNAEQVTMQCKLPNGGLEDLIVQPISCEKIKNEWYI